jgi:ATP-dependent helicase/nuclease subunit A
LGRREVDETGAPVWRHERVVERPRPIDAEASAQPLPPIPDWVLRPAPAEVALRRLTPSHLPGPDQPMRSPGKFPRGRFIHRLLQTLPDLPETRRREAARRWLSHKSGLAEAEIEALVDETLSVIDHPEFAPLFGPSSRAEVGILAEIAERTVLVGRVDRLVVLPQTVIVADYKTNRPPPRHPDQVAPLHLRQMAAYRRALRQLYPDHDIRAVLVWTDGPALMELDSSRLDRILIPIRSTELEDPHLDAP